MTDSAKTDPLGRASRLRLKQAREAAGKHPSELAKYADNSPSSYYDLENCDGEIFMNIDLRNLDGLCAALGMRPKNLFILQPPEHAIRPEELCREINAYLKRANIALNDFEEKVNYTIAPAFEDASQVLTWNIDCLRNVCSEIGVNWIEALPT
jgi:transcriptional regulator with XRE-family HTH domain